MDKDLRDRLKTSIRSEIQDLAERRIAQKLQEGGVTRLEVIEYLMVNMPEGFRDARQSTSSDEMPNDEYMQVIEEVIRELLQELRSQLIH